MMKLEREGEGPLRLIVEGIHPEALSIIAVAVECLSWRPDMAHNEIYVRAIRAAAGQEELNPDEVLLLIGEDDQTIPGGS
jgi:hypothetical protein